MNRRTDYPGATIRPEDFAVPVEHLPFANELTTRLPYTESELRTRVMQAIGAASACWDNLEGAGVFISERAADIGDDLIEHVLRLTTLGEPALGCATNAQLITELETRMRLGHGHLDYRTAD